MFETHYYSHLKFPNTKVACGIRDRIDRVGLCSVVLYNWPKITIDHRLESDALSDLIIS